jgi:hypothetical protein
MQSACSQFRLYPATQHRCQPSKRAVDVSCQPSDMVSDFRELSLIREILHGEKAEKQRVKAAHEWHIACT